MESPLVSISCITYNHEDYIKQCLDGFLMQKTDFKIEILINDDCSTDNTATVIREYQEKHPDLIFPNYQKRNLYSKGVRGMNLRFNFPRAKGKYIALCEGDDYWTDPYKLQKQIDFLENHPDYQIHSGLITGLQDDKFSDYDLDAATYSIKDFYTRSNLFTCTVMFRNNFKYNIEDFTSKIYLGDWYLYCMMLHQTQLKAFRSDEIYAVYRKHDQGVTKLISYLELNKSILRQIELIYESFGPFSYSSFDFSLINSYYIRIFKNLIELRDYSSAIKCIIQNYKHTKNHINLKKLMKTFIKTQFLNT